MINSDGRSSLLSRMIINFSEAETGFDQAPMRGVAPLLITIMTMTMIVIIMVSIQ